MRRQRRTPIEDDYYPTNNTYTDAGGSIHGMEDFMQMERLDTNSTHRFENTIEAKIADGDTLQALALRFHCTVADIKRLNKIDKENEIYARKVVKIPITVHSVLLGTALPTVHKSGNNSPKHSQHLDGESERNIMRDPLKDAHVMLGEKLMVASVNSAGTDVSGGGSVNNVILNSKMAGTSSIYSRNGE